MDEPTLKALDADLLEAQLGRNFSNQEILRRALTHKSRVFERTPHQLEKVEDNEQLEFLGDAILGFLVSEALLEQFPSAAEGRLSKMKSYLVSASHLYDVALTLKLGEFLVLGRGEELSGGREKKALLANAMEALIAAIYLDGGIDWARSFVRKEVLDNFEALGDDGDLQGKDNKSALQEITQLKKLPLPRYVVTAEKGPEHSKTFTVEVRVGKELSSQAQGISKKEAGQKAAGQLIEQLNSETSPQKG